MHDFQSLKIALWSWSTQIWPIIPERKNILLIMIKFPLVKSFFTSHTVPTEELFLPPLKPVLGLMFPALKPVLGLMFHQRGGGVEKGLCSLKHLTFGEVFERFLCLPVWDLGLQACFWKCPRKIHYILVFPAGNRTFSMFYITKLPFEKGPTNENKEFSVLHNSPPLFLLYLQLFAYM